jgi:hypothetical protein
MLDVVMWYRFGWRTVSKCERVSDWGSLARVVKQAIVVEEAFNVRPNLYNETRVGDVTDVFREMKPESLIIDGDS